MWGIATANQCVRAVARGIKRCSQRYYLDIQMAQGLNNKGV
jgi:hypothetical protein